MAVVLAIGVLLSVVGVVLLLNVFGAGDYVIRRVTSQFLGSLPPGYAASQRGFRIYALLVLAIGVVCIGISLTLTRLVPLGAGLIVIGAITFGILSMLAITGEIETARAKR